MLAGAPLPFPLGLDAGAIDKKVQRAGSTAIRQVYVRHLLTAANCAEIWHDPTPSNEPQQTFDKPGRLSQRPAEQHLQGQAGLNRSLAELLLSEPLVALRWHPDPLRINSNRKWSALP